MLRKPDWLFLDETTASLDLVSEHNLYDLVRRELMDTTLVSIAHRPSVATYHDRVMSLDVDGEGCMQLKEQKTFTLEPINESSGHTQSEFLRRSLS